MIRGKPVLEALSSLERTNKKAARLLEDLIRSAMANASQNDKQKPEEMIIKSLIVNKAQSYYRGYPMARGRQRVYRKFMSHITVHLGYPDEEIVEKKEKPKQTASQSDKKTVKKSTSTASKAKKTSETKSATKTKMTDSKVSSKKDSSSSSSSTTST